MFDFIFLAGKQDDVNAASYVRQVDGKHFKSVERFAHLPFSQYERVKCAAHINGDLYVITDHIWALYVKKYSDEIKSWSRVGILNYSFTRSLFCSCVFMDKIFIIGGLNSAINTVFSDFLAFDTRESEWIKGSEVASMTVERAQPACTSFQGRIVVSGGFNLRRDPDYRNKSVEAYDHAQAIRGGRRNKNV